jgi:hypothetical protein
MMKQRMKARTRERAPGFRMITPKGIATGYVFIDQEDSRYGGYKVNLSMDKTRAVPLMDRLAGLAKEAFGKTAGVHFPFTQSDDGIVTFKFKSDFAPAVFDIHGDVIFRPARDERDEDEGRAPQIGRGSLLKVDGNWKTTAIKGEGETKRYVTGYFSGVQVLIMATRGGFGDASEELDGDEESQDVRTELDDQDAQGAFGDAGDEGDLEDETPFRRVDTRRSTDF